MLQIPPNVKTFELSNSTIWFDEEGILYSKPKPVPVQEPTTEEIYSEMDKFREIIGHQKVCMIAEANAGGSKPPKKEHRALMAREISSVTKAMAVITTSPLSRMIINLFFGFAPPDYPVKMCRSEKEAKDWIRQYL